VYVTFDEISPKARTWVFLANRKLSSHEIEQLHQRSISFVNQWTSHQQEVRGSFEILHDVVWIIAADNAYTQVGGCSTDSLLRFVQETQQLLNIDFFDRRKVLLLRNEITKISSIDELTSIDNLDSCQILNPLVEIKEDIPKQLFLPFADSRYATLV
jgi:hypothetical protein